MLSKISFKNIKINNLQILLLLFVIGVCIRLYASWMFYDNPRFIIDGGFVPLLNPDSGLYGYYVNLLLNNMPHLSDVHLIEYILYMIVSFTPFSLDQILYFGPAFFASLIIIPTYLIMDIYIKSKIIISISSIIASIGYGFYSRSYLGYFDTDVLNIFFPMMILYSMLLIISKNDYRYSAIGIISNIGYLLWYHSSEPIIYALNGFFIIFGILFYLKKTELYKTYILLGISIVKISFLYKVVILIVAFGGFYFLKINYRYYLFLFIVSFFAILYYIDISQFAFHINRYINTNNILTTNSYNFISPMQYVAEADSESFMKIITNISGNIYIFIFSIIAYIILAIRHKEFLLSLPLVLLGLASIKAGIRFHIYGVIPLIISYGFLVYLISQKIKINKFKNTIIIILFLFPIYESYKSVDKWNNNMLPIFDSAQIKAVNILKKQATNKDYIVTWWDYGWPLWYYTNMQTMIDNGTHHEDNYTVAKIFMSTSQTFSYNAIHYFYNLYSKRKTASIIQALNENTIDNLDKKLNQTNLKHINKIKKYIVLPYDMLRISSTIFSFANIDIQTGEKLGKKHFYKFSILKKINRIVYLNNGYKIDEKSLMLLKGNRSFAIKSFYDISYKNNKKIIKVNKLRNQGFNLIKYHGRLYIMDDYYLNTTLIQLLVFNNYDKKLFKPISIQENISIFEVL
jgi:dolichyl-diphosphooligosaccharide--protein glycosyltransferase/undecaprenyl-diphosphooligosaccharide--protein glycosyltransferase